MPHGTLAGLTVLVVEDEYGAAFDIERDLGEAGAFVIGPVPTLRQALDAIWSTETIDAAVLDVNLCGEMVFPAADLLRARGIPFIFATGYDRAVLPPRFRHIHRSEKPLGTREISHDLTDLILGNVS